MQDAIALAEQLIGNGPGRLQFAAYERKRQRRDRAAPEPTRG